MEEYFNLKDINSYKKVATKTYSADTPEARWAKDTRAKLEYLVGCLSKRLNQPFRIVYKEKPNGQAGQGKIVFKNYILIGFAPEENNISDKLFIKLEFGALSSTPVFNINLDLNFKDDSSPFKKTRDDIYESTYKEFEIDDSFPSNWNDLTDLIANDIKILKAKFDNMVAPSTSKENNTLVNLLRYKKQIILQGPPGTGKTRMAKAIVNEMIGIKPQISDQDILDKIVLNQTIDTSGGKRGYKIVEIDAAGKRLKLQRESETEDYTSFNNIIDAYRNRLWETTISQNTARRAASVAKYLSTQYNKTGDLSKVALVQFHPSYSYEDFVRGIVAKTSGEDNSVFYEAENKILGNLAKNAQDNFSKSQKFKKAIYTTLVDFANSINANSIDFSGKNFSLTSSISISNNLESISGNLGYREAAWTKETTASLNLKDLYILTEFIITNKFNYKEEKLPKGISTHLDYEYEKRKIYYKNVLILFFENYDFSEYGDARIQNHFLVIDEINRANLSSVLGELIYALEYRGEEVESMYAVGGDNKLVLPPNLYIIGTMNTADRSVGHIDYAIRRRFAFVDVLPKDLTKDNSIEFNSQLFKEVSALFIKNFDAYSTDNTISLERAETLSAEFRPEDVWLGHSYFIQKRTEDGTLIPEDFSIRLEYEIKPILLEYVKDGILIDPAGTEKIEKRIKDLKVLD